MVKLKSFDIATSVTDSFIEVFDTMLSMELELSPDDSITLDEKNRIVGSVSLAGKIKGVISIQVSDEFSRLITAAMQGVEVDKITDEEDVKDVIRELCNIVAGNLKSLFCDAGLICELSPPSFTTGLDFEIESLNVSRYERYVFKYKDHHVIVEVAVKEDESESEDFKGKEGEDSRVIDDNVVRDFDIRTPLVESTMELFDTMLSMEIHEAEDSEMPPPDKEEERVVGSVDMAGLISGNMSIHISKKFAVAMTASMLGIDVEEVTGEDEVKDVIGELCNIIGGNLKSKLCDAGMYCTLSTPSYTHGTDFDIEIQSMPQFERIKFVHGDEEFYIQAGIKLSESADMSKPSEKADDTGLDSIISQDDIDALLKASNSEPETKDEKHQTTEDLQKEIDSLVSSHSDPPVPEDVSASPPDDKPDDSEALWDEKHLDIVLDIPLEVKVEFGKTSKKICELIGINKGSVIQFPNMDGDPVDLVVNNTLIARGKIVIENDRYGIQITETVSREQRILSIM